MDFGIEIFVGIINGAVAAVAAVLEAVAGLIAGLLELLLYFIEFAFYLALLPFKSSKPAQHPQKRKLPEWTGVMVCRSLYAALALGAVFSLIYFVWLREPLPQPRPPAQPSSIDTARHAVERIKELLPPKSPP